MKGIEDTLQEGQNSYEHQLETIFGSPWKYYLNILYFEEFI